jgi:hypothetical protein
MSISTLKWPVFAEDGAVFHPLHVLTADHALVAGRGHEDVADLGRALHRQYLEAVHCRLEGPKRVDLGDDHLRAVALRPARDAAPHQP